MHFSSYSYSISSYPIAYAVMALLNIILTYSRNNLTYEVENPF